MSIQILPSIGRTFAAPDDTAASGQLLSVQQLSSGRSHISHFKPDAALKAQQSTQNLDRPLAVESENLTATVFGPHLAKISICIPHF
ncbi:MAG: hypothetical protein ABI180_06740 [Microcoleus sp.]